MEFAFGFLSGFTIATLVCWFVIKCMALDNASPFQSRRGER